MAITIGANSLEGNSDWELRVNSSTKVEQIRNQYLQGNQNTPSFVYHGTSGWTYFSTATWNVMNDTRMGTWTGYQRGAGSYGFSTSEGAYYAPVTGYYYFHCDFYMLNNTNTTSNYTHLLFGRNNSQGWAGGGRTPYIIHGHGNRRGNAGSYPHGPNISAVMYLTEGQYCNIRIYHNNGGQCRFYGNHSFFCGHLID